ncbi:MAG: GNAT family N-acetyltransferase [bacterium]|nr:GNAT family N-acetyltransferase [bacterium]
MIDFKPLHGVTLDDLNRVAPGYTSTEKYVVSKTERDDHVVLTLALTPLEVPYIKQYAHDEDLVQHYSQVVKSGHSWGAYAGKTMVALAIVEHQHWNNTVNVWEFHVAPDYRGQQIGRGLMEKAVDSAQNVGARVMVFETQNTNVPAIRFYRRMGFEVDAVDLSFYTNHDVSDGEVAVFMKRKLSASHE